MVLLVDPAVDVGDLLLAPRPHPPVGRARLDEPAVQERGVRGWVDGSQGERGRADGEQGAVLPGGELVVVVRVAGHAGGAEGHRPAAA